MKGQEQYVIGDYAGCGLVLPHPPHRCFTCCVRLTASPSATYRHSHIEGSLVPKTVMLLMDSAAYRKVLHCYLCRSMPRPQDLHPEFSLALPPSAWIVEAELTSLSAVESMPILIHPRSPSVTSSPSMTYWTKGSIVSTSSPRIVSSEFNVVL